MDSSLQIISLVLVGALWGCTNPLLRKGSTEVKAAVDDQESSSFLQSFILSLSTFRNVSVWLPYLLNQAGSLLYYNTLRKSDLSLAVPICNGLSLVFSMATSYVLGERVDKPVQTIVGAALVMGGVVLCLLSREEEGTKDPDTIISHTRNEL